MKIKLSDPRVSQAIEVVKKKHNISHETEFTQIFEEQYHCKIVADPDDCFCTQGWLYISEDKYSNWFVLQFGEGND